MIPHISGLRCTVFRKRAVRRPSQVNGSAIANLRSDRFNMRPKLSTALGGLVLHYSHGLNLSGRSLLLFRKEGQLLGQDVQIFDGQLLSLNIREM